MAAKFDVHSVRQQYPALSQSQVFFDNAGGSQVPQIVVDSIKNYLTQTNVQLGAGYSVSQKSTSLYEKGLAAGAQYINAQPSEVVTGASTTQLLNNLSLTFDFSPGDEIIISKIDHEANIGPWVRMAERQKLTIKWWSVPADDPVLRVETLKELLSERTKLVTCTHASNLLGTIHDIKAFSRAVHTIPGAVICVDAVAYAPHRQVDVQELEADFYVFSWYKVFGPHISMLYGKTSAQSQLKSLGHYFHPKDFEHKIGLAAGNYELTASIPSIVSYFGSDLKQAWYDISQHEQTLQATLLDYLNSRADIKVYGERSVDYKLRVPVVSFTVDGWSSEKLVKEVEKRSEFGFREGHMYSKRLVNEVFGLPDEGVVRVSMVHYNTEDEVKRFVGVLRDVLEGSKSG